MASAMTFAVVTGANRGIGLALVAALKQRGDGVLAACRASSPELAELDVEVVEGVDVATDDGIAKLKASVGHRAVDLLVNNAGIFVWNDGLGKLDVASIRKQFEVNALAPLLVTEALRPTFAKGAKVALITSRMGSIDDNTSGGSYGYRMSKAALNMAGKTLAVDLRSSGIAVALLHPGMVKTDMIGDLAGAISPSESARGLLARIDELTIELTGSFWHANGQRLPW